MINVAFAALQKVRTYVRAYVPGCRNDTAPYDAPPQWAVDDPKRSAYKRTKAQHFITYINAFMASAWDRSRRIPWSRLDQTPAPPGEKIDYVSQRERILGTLAREKALAEQEHVALLREQKHGSGGKQSASGEETTWSSSEADSGAIIKKNSWTAIPFSSAEMIRQATFGVCMGSITGAVFGFMDGMKQAGESTVLKKASNAAKGKFILQGTSRAGIMFGGFFGGFHVAKYGIRVIADPGDYSEITLAGAISMGAMAVKPTTRASMPYAGMLIAMDVFHTYMSEK